MRARIWIVVAAVVLVALAFWFGNRQGTEPVPSIPPTGQPAARPAGGTTLSPVPAAQSAAPTQPVPGGTAPQPAGTPPAAGAKAPLVAPRGVTEAERPEKIEADSIALNIRHYGQRFGGNPIGTNAEIVKQMMGDNEKRATYLPAELQRLNPQGELIDGWGTPYFFHQLTSQQMEVRSAGPDRQLWTPDDIVTR